MRQFIQTQLQSVYFFPLARGTLDETGCAWNHRGCSQVQCSSYLAFYRYLFAEIQEDGNIPMPSSPHLFLWKRLSWSWKQETRMSAWEGLPEWKKNAVGMRKEAWELQYFKVHFCICPIFRCKNIAIVTEKWHTDSLNKWIIQEVRAIRKCEALFRHSGSGWVISWARRAISPCPPRVKNPGCPCRR